MDLNKGTSTEVYKNYPKFYNKAYKNGNLNEKITIQQNKAGLYKVVVYIKRSGTSSIYDSYVQSAPFVVKPAESLSSSGGTNPVKKIELTQVYLLLNDNQTGNTKYSLNFNKDDENSYSIDLSNIPDSTNITNSCFSTTVKAKLTIDYTESTKDLTTDANVVKSLRISYDFKGIDQGVEGAILASCRAEVEASGNVIISIKAVDLSNPGNSNTFSFKIKVK